MSEAQLFSEALNRDNINYIFLKRGQDNTILPLPIKKIFCIFAVLDKALGGSGLTDVKSVFWKTDVSDDPELCAVYSKQGVEDEHLCERLISRTGKIPNLEKWTVIVFSEHFFSSAQALDSASVNEIIRCCNVLTTRHKHLIICINFFQKYNFLFHLYDRVYGYHSRPYLFSPPLPPSLAPVNPAECIQSRKPEVKTELLSERNRYSLFRFANYSLVMWNGVPISIYRKTIYHTEQDSLASVGYGFDFGNWKNYPTIELHNASPEHKEFAKLFNGPEPLVTIRICADMLHAPLLSPKTKLLIIQANGLPTRCAWESVTTPTTCCIVDTSNFGMFTATYDTLRSGKYKKYNFKKNTFPDLEKELSCEVCEILEPSHD